MGETKTGKRQHATVSDLLIVRIRDNRRLTNHCTFDDWANFVAGEAIIDDFPLPP